MVWFCDVLSAPSSRQDGTSWPVSDDVVDELVDAIKIAVNENYKELFQDGSSGSGPAATLEIEARLGNIIDLESDQRLNLPTMTPTIIDGNWGSCRFEPGLSSLQFHELHAHICQLAGTPEVIFEDLDSRRHAVDDANDDGSERVAAEEKLRDEDDIDFAPNQEKNKAELKSNKRLRHSDVAAAILGQSALPVVFSKCIPSFTLVKTFRIADDDEVLRAVYPLDTNYKETFVNKPLELIYKEKLMKFDIYMGPDIADRPSWWRRFSRAPHDVRVSINVEHKRNRLDSATLLSKRKRIRHSFIRVGREFRLDMTNAIEEDSPKPPNTPGGDRASNSQFPPPPPSPVKRWKPGTFEIELELNPELILEAISEKDQSNTQLRKMCRNFWSFMKSLCLYLDPLKEEEGEMATKSRRKLYGFSDFESLERPEYDSHRYCEYICKTEPLLGDYLYREVSSVLEKTNKMNMNDLNGTASAEQSKLQGTTAYYEKQLKPSGPYIFDAVQKTIRLADTAELSQKLMKQKEVSRINEVIH